MSLLLTDVRLVPVGGPAPSHPVDVRVTGSRVSAVGAGLSPVRADAEIIPGEGRWLIPGLWDAHVHLGQWARQGTRLNLAGATGLAEALRLVFEGLGDGEGLLVGGGYRPARWADPPTVAALDAVTGERPVVLVSGDAHAGWINSAGLRLLGLAEREDPITEAAWFAALPAVLAIEDAQVGPGAYAVALKAAAGLGVVGVHDYEFEPGFRTWPHRYAAAQVPLRVRTSTYPVDLDEAIEAGLRTGTPLVAVDGEPIVTMGSLKIISDGSLNTRTAHCCRPYADGRFGVQNVPADELSALLTRARAHGIEVALHAIGDAAVRIAVDAFETTGVRGSIEHLQLARREEMARLAQLDVVASVQPAHLLDDRQVTADIWGEARAARSFELRELVDAGVRLALGSDAPVAPLDPWLAMAAAVHRGEPEAEPWFAEHSLTPAEALAASTGGRASVAVGAPADLALLDADPLSAAEPAEAAWALRSMHVAATVVAGRVVHRD